MNKLLVVLIFISLGWTTFSQNQTDIQGRKQGEWIKYHEGSKKIRYKGQFKDDKPVGTFVYYYLSGDPSTVLEYESDTEALCKSYYETGTLMAKGYYLNQEKDGVWWYFNPEKLVMAKEVYKNGKLNGVSYKYFPAEVGANLVVLEEINYVDGVSQGKWTQYYKDGAIQVQGNYKDGLYYGKCTWYSPDGKVDVVGYYNEKGEEHGFWKFYENGEEKTVVYRYGRELKKKDQIKKFEQALKNGK